MTRAFAPGKLVLTGAYAVLEGAPSIAIAVSRGAIADTARPAATPTPEVRAALGAGKTAPEADAAAMFVAGRKLGLGASAAILVASLGALEAEAGADLTAPDVRQRIFERARAGHAAAQSGGSGVDVATSVYGGAIRYRMGAPVERVELPRGLVPTVFACGTSARTSELRGRVDALAVARPAAHRERLAALVAIAGDAAAAVAGGDAAGLVTALRRTARALDALGGAAEVAIVPPGFAELEALAAEEEAAFCVSGAGGGDVAVLLGPAPASARFLARATALGLTDLPLSIDAAGLRRVAVTAPHASASPSTLQGHS